jgi:hypothetical protein
MSIVVSDTAPIRALHFLGHSRLLQQLFGAVLIPPAVAEELETSRKYPISVSELSFIAIRTPSDDRQVSQFAATPDLGEAQALALAKELNAMLLIDEIDGRLVAADAGIPFIGVLGVLAAAKRKGFVSEIRPLLDRLREELHFRIAQKLYEEFLKSVDESRD